MGQDGELCTFFMICRAFAYFLSHYKNPDIKLDRGAMAQEMPPISIILCKFIYRIFKGIKLFQNLLHQGETSPDIVLLRTGSSKYRLPDRIETV